MQVQREYPNQFFYKTSYSDPEFKVVSLTQKTRRAAPFHNVQLECAYNDSLPIAKKKYDDLMYLLDSNVIKKCHSYFYRSLRVANE